jgi:hypothetical protein
MLPLEEAHAVEGLEGGVEGPGGRSDAAALAGAAEALEVAPSARGDGGTVGEGGRGGEAGGMGLELLSAGVGELGCRLGLGGCAPLIARMSSSRSRRRLESTERFRAIARSSRTPSPLSRSEDGPTCGPVLAGLLSRGAAELEPSCHDGSASSAVGVRGEGADMGEAISASVSSLVPPR